MRTLRSLPVLALVSLLAACGGDDGPTTPRMPDVQGTYDFSAPVNEISGARFTGDMQIIDADRSDQTFGGTANIKLLGPDGAIYGNTSETIANGTIDRAGQISFNFRDANWKMTGQYQNGTITGTWLISGGSNFSGSFTAIRR